MRSLILYIPEAVTLDLGQPDLGHPDGRAIIERHYRQGSKPSLGFNRDNPAFACMSHLGGTNPGLFIKNIEGEWWAVHYERGECASRRVPAPMSDEHKRQTEYWARAAEDAGWRVEMEHSLHTGTRPDALIYAPVLTGVEVQRSPMTPAAAVARTRKAAQAGVSDLWFSGHASAPGWAWRVPTVLSRELGIPGEGQSWDGVPPRRSVTAAGLRVIKAEKCSHLNFSSCPYGRNFCGKYHPRPRPWGGLAVDDVAARFPAGEMVMLRFWGVRTQGSRHREAVFLVSPQDRALYEELTGTRNAIAFEVKTEQRPPRTPSGEVACGNVQSPAVSPLPFIVNAVPKVASQRWAPGVKAKPGTCAECGVSKPPPGAEFCQACRLARRLRGEH